MPITFLPLDLFLYISSFLPDSDSQSLRNTCRGLRNALPHARLRSDSSSLWLDVREQSRFLLRLLRDKPQDDHIVCRRCITFAKRWPGSPGEAQTNLMSLRRTAGDTGYDSLDSVCEKCIGQYEEPCKGWCWCVSRCVMGRRGEYEDVFAKWQLLTKQLTEMPEKERLVVCRRCVAIKPRAQNTSQDSITAYNSWDSMCVDCIDEYEALARSHSIGGILKLEPVRKMHFRVPSRPIYSSTQPGIWPWRA